MGVIDKTVENTGKTLQIKGLNSKRSRHYTPPELSCTRSTEGSQHSPIFNTHLYELVTIEGVPPIEAEIPDKEFSKYFTIIKREVFFCHKSKQNLAVVGDSDIYFRVENEAIGRVAVRQLIHDSDDVTIVMHLSIPDGVTVRYKEIKFFGTLSWQPVWIGRDIAFSLSPTTFYRTLIGPEGYDLRVGEGNSTNVMEGDSFKCQKTEEYKDKIDAFKTVVKLKLNSNSVFSLATVLEESEPSFYKTVNTEILICSDDDKKSGFVRVLNTMELLVPVREIESYDGIYIVPKTLSDGHSLSATIIELKYLHLETMEPVIFGGTLIFETPGLIEPTLDARRHALPVCVDEAVRWTGHGLPADPGLFRDYYRHQPYEPIMKTLQISNSQPLYSLALNFKIYDYMLHSVDVTKCELSSENGRRLLPPCSIKNLGLSTAEQESTKKQLDVNSNYSQYLSVMANEVWKCEGKTVIDAHQKNRRSFLKRYVRVVNEVEMVLTEATPLHIGEIDNFPAKGFSVKMRNGQAVATYKEVRNTRENEDKYITIFFDGITVLEDYLRKKDGDSMSGTVVVPIKHYENYFNRYERIGGLSHNDSKTYKFTTNDKEGVMMKIGSVLTEDSSLSNPGEQGAEIICEINETHVPRENKLYDMHIYFLNATKEWEEINFWEDGLLEGQHQDVWTCRRNHMIIFYRVTNYVVIQKDINIDYGDGIYIGLLDLPDKSTKNVEIHEVKFLHPQTLKAIRYEGDLQLEPKYNNIPIARSLFPLDSKEASSNGGFGYQKTASGDDYWTLDALAVLLARKRGIHELDTHTDEDEILVPAEKGDGLYRAFSHENGPLTLVIGCQYEETIPPEKKLKCMEHKWNKEFWTEYHPKVVEVTAERVNELDWHIFKELFKIEEQIIWICVLEENDLDKNVFLRIETKLLSAPRMHARPNVLILRDTVDSCDKIVNGTSYSMVIEETVLINIKTNKYVKYDGVIYNINEPEKYEPPKHAFSMLGAVFYTPALMEESTKNTLKKSRRIAKAATKTWEKGGKMVSHVVGSTLHLFGLK
ncbi:uncharacterized protein LOC111060702 isoform X2 [Nilaparvata lugens]|uniref:uncharacterized protein LOC111060702 isoform X2 n=1 Tax=Nilaparvata lugens TaxID=108931 RepID=UPI00193D740D|nr:uncharacterized protein LOC111060702 isoform X2 [Nilaparvata lugens]